MSLRIFPLIAAAIVFSAAPSQASPDVVSLSGEYLTIKSRNVSVSLKGAEVTRISNQITGELYFNNVVKLPPMLEMHMLGGEKGPLNCTTWRIGRANDEGIVNSAQTSF